MKKGCLFTQDLLAHYEVFLQKVELAKDRIRNRCIWSNKQITDMGRPLVNQSLVDYGIMYTTDFLGTDVHGEYYLMNYTEFKTNKMGGDEHHYCYTVSENKNGYQESILRHKTEEH